jgi:sterol desaturase/sphingolipid hydroxylase (fatty acid hydroxylase superfamily)
MDSGLLGELTRLLPLATRATSRLWSGLWPALLVFGGVFVIETLSGASRQRYATRGFLIDAAHCVFYAGGFFTFLVYNPLISLIRPPLAVLDVGILSTLPPLVAYFLYFVYFDFFSYWWHRALHQSRFLWAFHSVHHSPPVLTGVTSLRRHVVEIALASVLTYVVILPLGALTTNIWPILSILWLVRILESVHHAELNWKFWPVRHIVVSPVYHSLHHSSDPAHYHKNYAIILSVWDYLFGTAAEPVARPRTYGVDGMGLQETFTSQLFTPFRNFARQVRPERQVERQTSAA